MKKTFKDNLYKLFKKNARLWDEKTKELNETLLKDLIDKLDEKLIELLLSDKKAKEKFFIKVKDVFVLKQNDLKFFIDENKLDNSYTQYQNKIGLRVGNKLLSERNEVVLDWPFKDCVLEGGMTKEDQKRNEIFFNEILAKDEIDRLEDPKAFVGWKRYTAKGEEKVKELKRDKDGIIKENLIIKGNNLLAIASLKKEFAGKIKLVYLDPPYNTPGEANTFSYNNSFNHSSWLTFMKNRVEIVKELVSDDGFICLAIDDVEYAYLKVLCDEILGRDNFLATVVVQIKKEGRTDSEFFATSHDYAIFYCKNKSKAKLNTLSILEENAMKWKEVDETGRFYWRDFIRTGGNSTPIDRPKQDYVIYYSKAKNEIVGVGGYSDNEPSQPYNSELVYYINKKGECQEITKQKFLQLHNGLIEFHPRGSKGERQVWRWSDREKVLWAAKLGEINLIENKIKIKDRIREGSKPTTTWYDSDFNATSHGTLLLKKMFDGKKVFSYPKSLFTMIDIIKIATNTNTKDIILDMFGGSATTAHAVNRVNKIDQGNRKFIIIEQMDYIQKATLPRIKKSLENIGDSFVFFELAKWNEEAKEKILKAKNLKDLEKLFDELYERYFLNYNVKTKEFKEKIIKEEGFEKLSLDEQKKLFVEMLDMNQMYVNFSERADKKYNLSKDDITLSEDFYNIKK